MNLRIFENLEDLSQGAARAIRESNAKAIGLTGGSTPKRLYEILSDSLPQAVTWVLIDERYVPRDDPQSNAGMIERTLFKHGIPPRWLSFDTSFPDPADSARDFEARWKSLGIDRIDLMLLGCGEDGHTASLFPGTPVLEVRDRIASEVFVPRLDQWRVTITMPVIQASGECMVLVAGESKVAIVRDVREGKEFPITHATRGVETWWFVTASTVR